MKKFSFVLSMTVLFLFAGILSAQERTPVPQQTKSADFGIVAMLTKVAANEDDDEVHEKYAGKINTDKFFSEWGFIDVRFPVLVPKAKDAWDTWVDDLSVRLEIIGISRSKNGNTPVALEFTQPLNPVHADGKVHHVRFFIPPYVLYRYIAPTKNRNEVRKRMSQMYVLATVLWRGNPISYITSTGKNSPARRAILDNMQKLRDRRSNYLENTLLPAEYTPWAGRSFDRFESMKINMQQRRR
jgi:hypothetical protein